MELTTEQIAFDPAIQTLIAWYKENRDIYGATEPALLAVHMSTQTGIIVDGKVARAVRIWVEETEKEV